MPGFQLENNVPEVYVEESRDFQLLCRLIDVYLRGTIDRAASIIRSIDLDKCNEGLLPAIAWMQGFTTHMYIPPKVLRNICRVFPYCIKRKGTEDAIYTMAQAVLSTDRLIYNIDCSIRKAELTDNFLIEIVCYANDHYIPYLAEALRFIVPAGWDIRYRFYRTVHVTLKDKVKIRSKVAGIAGLINKIVSEKATEFKLDNSFPSLSSDNPSPQATTLSTKQATHSRIGIAKIVKAGSNTELKEETIQSIKINTGEPVKLINGQQLNFNLRDVQVDTSSTADGDNNT